MALTTVQQGLIGSGVAGTGPAFKAYLNAGQGITVGAVNTVAFNTKVFDTGGCYNNTGSTVTLNGISVPAYSFAPNVAGYYLIYACVGFGGTSNSMGAIFYNQNGTLANGSAQTYNTSIGGQASITTIAYFNGTSNYVYCAEYSPNATGVNGGGAEITSFSACLIRAA